MLNEKTVKEPYRNLHKKREMLLQWACGHTILAHIPSGRMSRSFYAIIVISSSLLGQGEKGEINFLAITLGVLITLFGDENNECVGGVHFTYRSDISVW